MKDDNPIISIIIVNYKVREKLLNCIKSISGSKIQINFEIIIVDNEGDRDLEKELKNNTKVKYINTFKNLGFGAGNNLGAKNAKGEYLFFLNPDTLIVDDVIKKLYEFIKSNKKVGIVSPLLVNTNLEPFSTQSRKELTPINAIYSLSFLRKFFPKKNIYNDDFFRRWDKESAIEADTVPGAALMISKKLFDKINGFDEQFFLYFEENDLSKRIRNLGLKLYINPNAKVSHEVGQSTKQIKQRDDIFAKSRFLYFRKHYGILKSVLLESFLRINKYSLAIFLILLTALFLRVVNLHISMPFIGDQGWFYLSARDLLIDGKIPLIGITSSHTWLHQGPLWTYMLSLALFLGNFNPIAGGILTALFGVGSVFLIYKLGMEMFSGKVGLIASSLYAVSPLIVFFERMPFDPSVVPFFTILYFYAVFKWLTGDTKFFPLILFFLAILYNLELATFILAFPFILILAYGVIKRKSFVKQLLSLKLIFYSFIFLSIPMIPVLIYDFSNGFKQTVIFLGWVIYKPFSFLFSIKQIDNSESFSNVVSFILLNIQKIILNFNALVSLLIFLSAFLYLTYLVYKEKNIFLNSKTLLLLFTAISIFGILVNKTPSDAYLPIIFPFVIFIIALFFDKLLNFKKAKYFVALGVFILLGLNFYFAYKNTFKPDYQNRIKASNEIIALTKGREYNLIGKGEGSWFESFTMNYQYLLWWKGYPPSEKKENLKILIKEERERISVSKL